MLGIEIRASTEGGHGRAVILQSTVGDPELVVDFGLRRLDRGGIFEFQGSARVIALLQETLAFGNVRAPLGFGAAGATDSQNHYQRR